MAKVTVGDVETLGIIAVALGALYLVAKAAGGVSSIFDSVSSFFGGEKKPTLDNATRDTEAGTDIGSFAEAIGSSVRDSLSGEGVNSNFDGSDPTPPEAISP